GFSNERPLLVAASTHAPEERIVIEAFKEISRLAAETHKPRLLIAPRHPERFAEVAALLSASGLAWTRRTHEPYIIDETCEAVLLDSIGELRAIYPLAEIVFVGGSIAQTGGHNVLEPAAAGACIVTGAHTQNFAAIVKAFREQQALIQLPDTAEIDAPHLLASVFTEILSDDKKREALGSNARAAFERNQGAAKRTVELLAPLFATPTKTAR
ncbi:MAG: 3-deoxy-D-manno-octulosonic acid transferase, partial [Pyrinomonadaceae bacterium]